MYLHEIFLSLTRCYNFVGVSYKMMVALIIKGDSVNNSAKCIALTLAMTWATGSFGQVAPSPAVSQRVHLAASASVQVTQDMLTLSLNTVREGNDSQTVQTQLKTAFDSALKVAKPAARPGLMEVKTGRFGMNPRYDRDGKITGWRGTAELILTGRDLTLIGETAGKVTTMTVNSSQFGLSPEQAQTAQSQAQSQAIAAYRQNATAIATDFGFQSYSLIEVNVSNHNDTIIRERPMMMAKAAMSSMADQAVPVEAGLTNVTVTVSGLVQLQ